MSRFKDLYTKAVGVRFSEKLEKLISNSFHLHFHKIIFISFDLGSLKIQKIQPNRTLNDYKYDHIESRNLIFYAILILCSIAVFFIFVAKVC